MNIYHIAGMVIAISLIADLAIFSGTCKKESDSTRNSSAIVAGVIMGTLVGGSSTVGTAQLAYNYGMSAWWFTLGGGIACLVLAFIYVKPLRASGRFTLVGIITQEYGEIAGLIASVLNSIGTFINLIPQLLTSSAVILVVWPSMGIFWTVLISALFMILYVIFGGTKGTGIVGILKLFLLYVSMTTCGIFVLTIVGGVSDFVSIMQDLRVESGINYFSLLSQGIGRDLGSGLSLVIGVLTTQTYAQGVLSGRTDHIAQKGALISAFLIPPMVFAEF